MPSLEGFVDVSGLLRCGVYVLRYRGSVVYIGKARQILARVYQHRDLWAQARKTRLPSFLAKKGVLFDEVFIKPCSPDRVDDLERELIARFRPKHNTLLQPPPTAPIEIVIGGLTLVAQPKAPERLNRRI